MNRDEFDEVVEKTRIESWTGCPKAPSHTQVRRRNANAWSSAQP
jgi:hypothetical protein